MSKTIEAEVEKITQPSPKRQEMWELWIWTIVRRLDGYWEYDEAYDSKEDAEDAVERLPVGEYRIVHIVLE